MLPRASMASAAFFDLDRTLLRRSSALALAPAFRRRGIISRRMMIEAAAWQVLFMLRGASHEAVRRAAVDGLLLLKGHTPDEMRELVGESMESVLRPLVYAESLDLVERHRSRGEPVFIVSATLQEIVQAIADDLGFDGALGTICEVEDGTYTGKAVRALHAEAKADCIRSLEYDLAASTAYSDSHTDLAFLEAVGNPVAVNPDRKLRKIATERGWPVQEFRGKS
jgi:HAD superfamily hydrolase (TIGR01490 family)